MKDEQRNQKSIFRILLTAGVICLCLISVYVGFSFGKKNAGITLETIGTQDPLIGNGTAEADESIEQTEPKRMLIMCAVNTLGKYAHYDPEELNGNLSDTLYYKEVENVRILIDSEWMELTDAIREGKVTSAEMFYWARTDAANGFCTEKPNSYNGLSNFVFTYPGEIDLFFSYDVYETPDGRQHLIDDLWVGRANTMDTYSNRGKIDAETGLRLDREDWGLSFRVGEVTPTGMTLVVIQSCGQQAGELTVEACYVSDAGGNYVDTEESGMVISRDSSTELTLDWAETGGALSAGDYVLQLQVWDIYDQCHPLIVKYNEFQEYDIPFTVP